MAQGSQTAFKFRPSRLKQPRHTPGTMNKTEAEYARYLDFLKSQGQIESYLFESVRLVLGKRCTYTPDFMVVKETHIEFHEVKGFLRDDAQVKFKTAADKFPQFKFIMVRWKNKTVGWEIIAEI